MRSRLVLLSGFRSCLAADMLKTTERSCGWMRPKTLAWGGNDLRKVAHLRHFRSFLKHFVVIYWEPRSPWSLWILSICWIEPKGADASRLAGWVGLKSFWLWNGTRFGWMKKKGAFVIPESITKRLFNNVQWINEIQMNGK